MILHLRLEEMVNSVVFIHDFFYYSKNLQSKIMLFLFQILFKGKNLWFFRQVNSTGLFVSFAHRLSDHTIPSFKSKFGCIVKPFADVRACFHLKLCNYCCIFMFLEHFWNVRSYCCSQYCTLGVYCFNISRWDWLGPYRWNRILNDTDGTLCWI